MKHLLSAITVPAIALSTLSSANAQQTLPRCSKVTARKEILSLSESEWSLITDVYDAMHRDGWFRWFSYLHDYWFGQIHGNAQFFPFHRRFVQHWESIGQRYDSSFIQPYWDEMRDYRTPAKSQVLTPPWAGGNGQENNCVMDGAQANWQMTFPDRHCLQRVFSNGGDIDPWYSPEYIQSFIQRDTTMEEFRPDIEFSIHGIVHVDISGDMSTTYSCNDILFWLHHSNIDRIWWEWQNVPSANGTLSNMWKMGGPNYDNTETTIYTDIVAYNEPISTVMQLGYGMMCYQYTDAFYPVSNIARSANVSESAYTVVRDDATLISYVASALRDNQLLLMKWFPKIGHLVTNQTTVPVSVWGGNKKEIPYPARLTPEWIAMHKFNVSDVNHVENDARQFVEEMFMAGYKSPI